MDGRIIFLPVEKTGAKYHCPIDMESDKEDEEDEQEVQAELLDLDVFYKHSKKLKLSQTIENYINIHFHSCLSNSVRRAMVTDNLLPNILAFTGSHNY